MEEIMIINERTSFLEGLSKLLEIKFANVFGIIKRDSKDLKNYNDDTIPKLIIVDEVSNEDTEHFLSDMRKRGSKIVVMSLEANEIHHLDLDLYNGFLIKNMPTSDMIHVIRNILEYNEVYVHPDVGHFFLKKLTSK